MADDASAAIGAIIASSSAPLLELISALRSKLQQLLPDAVEEPDPSAKLIGYTYQPGTYKGLVAAIAPHAAHVNLMFSKGVELLDHDHAGLLTGTGKKARHIKFSDLAEVDNPDVDELILEARRRTPRA